LGCRTDAQLLEEPVGKKNVKPERAPLDFTRILDRLKNHDGNKGRILTIPVWGWEASGKTTSLLTFFQLADALKQGLGIAYVKDLEEFQQALDGGAGTSFVELARSTPAKLKPLAERFFDQGQWLEGTTRPDQYLFRIRGNRTYGYVYLTDMPGGHFRDADNSASILLSRAHGVIVLVDPKRYSGSKVDDGEYRDEVEHRVARCVELELPTAVMLTKCDAYSDIDAANIDEVFGRLESLSAAAETVEIHRTSVFGDVENWDGTDTLPAASERKPDQLIFAWGDLLSRALLLDMESVKAKAPPLQLRAAAAQGAALPAKSVPEVRLVGSWSESPGRVLCSLPDTRRRSFLTMNAKGHLSEVRLQNDLSQEPEVTDLGDVAEPPDHGRPLRCQVRRGQVFLGAARDATTIWHGAVGDTLRPFTIHRSASWCVAPSGLFVSASKDGSVQLAQFGEKLILGELRQLLKTPGSGETALGWWDTYGCLALLNGTDAAFIQLDQDRFGSMLEIEGFESNYSSNALVEVAPSGLIAILDGAAQGDSAATKASEPTEESPGDDEADDSARVLHLVLGKEHALGAVATAPDVPFALATGIHLVAYVDDGDALHAACIQGNDLATTRNGCELPDEVASFAFSTDARTLLVAFDNATYGAFELRGWPHV
jgi:hypothetical protein